MLRNTLFFSSLIGAGSSEVGASIAMNAEDLEQVRDDHVAERAGLLRRTRRAVPRPSVSGTSICT